MNGFVSATIKLGRAKFHIDDLVVKVQAVGQNDAPNFVHTYDANREMHIYEIAVLPSPPLPLIQPIVGDAVQNMSAALDHLVWGLSEPEITRQGHTGTDVSFPIFLKHQHALESRIRYLSEPAKKAVRDVQPYNLRDEFTGHPLWLLRELSIEDKHKALNFSVVHLKMPILGSDRQRILGLEDDCRIVLELPESLKPEENFAPFLETDIRLVIPGLPERPYPESIMVLREIHKHIGQSVMPLFKPFFI